MTDASDAPPPREFRVRPYTLTGGRTRSDENLGIESLVHRTDEGSTMLPRLRMERRQIVQLCQEPLAVAEVSAHLHLPLGVAKVLITDLASDNLVMTHSVSLTVDHRPDTSLLERVLDGLQSL